MTDLIRTLWAATHAFDSKTPKDSIDYWLNMLESQIEEAREHNSRGKRDKALAEIADCIAVAFEALHRNGKNPEAFTVRRIRTRILPRVEEISRSYGADGHKRRSR